MVWQQWTMLAFFVTCFLLAVIGLVESYVNEDAEVRNLTAWITVTAFVLSILVLSQ